MTVKEVICEVLYMVGRYDVCEDLKEGAPLYEDEVRLRDACLRFFNAVVNELARGYFPVYFEEKLLSDNGKFHFLDFWFTPLEIKEVTANAKPIKWSVVANYLLADAKEINVCYSYVPDELTIDSKVLYHNAAVTKNLIEYGMIAEYYLAMGDAVSYELWENKYREEIENLLSRSKVRGRIPPRRWI